MKRYNIILLVDTAGDNVLMCRRRKPPYQGLLNLVGGKVEPGEDGLHAAYRELREETGVTARDVALFPVVTFAYPGGGAGLPAYELQAWAGRLHRDVPVNGEENPLCWIPLTEDFFDMEKYAGEGSIGHVLETVRRYHPEKLTAREREISLRPLTEADLPLLAGVQGCTADELLPMLRESQQQRHDGRYYEQFTICADDCVVGTASLYAQEDGSVSDGVEVFPTFRRCGFARTALHALEKLARESGYERLTAQVRTDNSASLALHTGCGFAVTETYINRRGREVCRMEKRIGGEEACGTK